MSVLVDKRFSGRGHISVIRRAIRETLASEGIRPPYEVSVVVGDDALIHELNLQYMGEDRPTDVLSFPQQEMRPAPKAAGWEAPDATGGKVVLGDIVVSLPTVERQAREHSLRVEQELTLVVVHATLHLLGYDHAEPDEREAMWRKQERIAQMVWPVSPPGG